MNKKIITTSARETQDFAEKLAKEMTGGEVIFLHGDLGSGKTTFTQGLAKALGIEKNIISPTFILMRSYKLPERKKTAKNLYHIDLYRTLSDKDIIELGLLELLGKKENIVVIEWPEKMGFLVPIKKIDLHFTFISENTREITIKQ